MKCDVDLRKDLFTNIVLAGGSTSFSGFNTRPKNELLGNNANLEVETTLCMAGWFYILFTVGHGRKFYVDYETGI